MNDDDIAVADITPFWRYAVGLSSGRCAAVPFWSREAAMDFFDESRRTLPWAGCRLYKRRFFKRLEIIAEYHP